MYSVQKSLWISKDAKVHFWESHSHKWRWVASHKFYKGMIFEIINEETVWKGEGLILCVTLLL